MRAQKRAFVLIGVIAAGAATTLYAVWAHDRPAHHFAVVTEGVLYRSGQPTETGWRAMRDRYHIRTVVCLRRASKDKDWWTAEDTFCWQNDIGHVVFPIRSDQPIEADCNRFLEIVTDPAHQPVLVHCKAGSVRTGVMVAAYRIAVQGWTYERAVAEAETFRFDAEDHKPYGGFLRRLASEARSRASSGHACRRPSGR